MTSSAIAVAPDVAVLGTYEFSERSQFDRSLEEKKKSGIFYTPDAATRILSQWAIRQPIDTILEPSFGGCGFLGAALDQLVALGSRNPATRLYGCDVDAAAFEYLTRLLGGKYDVDHFKHGDFLSLDPGSFDERRFEVIIGNPPYVSLHNMSVEQRTAARSAAESASIQMSKKASLWAYFIIHSMAFLKVGGRMAWVLPGSFLHADYADALREKLAASFRQTLAVQLEERLFLSEGTEESSVILLCEGYADDEPNPIKLARAADLSGLEQIVVAWLDQKLHAVELDGPPQRALLVKNVRERWEIVEQRNASRLRDYMTFKIGIVSGASKFFVLNQQAVQREGLPAEVLHPVVARFAHCRGVELNAADWEELRENGARCLLFSTERVEGFADTVSSYLEKFSSMDRAKNKTFKKRALWHHPYDGQTPDAFFSVMQTEGPTLVLNTAGVTCTNTLYRVSFRPDVDAQTQMALAVCLQSTGSQLSAEIEGRSYGSGGLKLEPSEASQVLVWLPSNPADYQIQDVFAEVNAHLRCGNRNAARQVADEFLVSADLFTTDEVHCFQKALRELRRSRSGSSRQKRFEK